MIYIYTYIHTYIFSHFHYVMGISSEYRHIKYKYIDIMGCHWNTDYIYTQYRKYRYTDNIYYIYMYSITVIMGILCIFLLYINIYMYMGIIMGMLMGMFLYNMGRLFLYNMGRMGFYQWDLLMWLTIQ